MILLGKIALYFTMTDILSIRPLGGPLVAQGVAVLTGMPVVIFAAIRALVPLGYQTPEPRIKTVRASSPSTDYFSAHSYLLMENQTF